MKKILLSMMFFVFVYHSKGQAVLNEIYFNPSSGESEYFEVFNSGAFENMDCYTLFSMYDNGTTKGFYVINFPNYSMNSNSFSIGTSSTTGSFTYQAGTYNLGGNDFSWNSLNMPGSNGYFKQFQLDVAGTGYTEVNPPVNTNDIFNTLPSNAGAKYITLLYKNGVIQNGLIINGTNGVSPTALKTTMPPLTVPSDGGNCAEFTVTFSTIANNELEYLTPAIGQSNGAFRTSDGKCGTWNKASNKGDNTPGSTNGPSTVITSEIAVSGSVGCGLNDNNKRVATYFVITSQTNVAAYPLTLQLYQDNGTVQGQLDAGDFFIDQHLISIPPANQTAATFTAELLNPNSNIIVIAKSTAGCFQTIQAISNTCAPLPVKLKSFTASRKQSNVDLKWVTTLEQNNSGFEVQRQSGAGGWKTVAFVKSQAVNGNSTGDLTYTYTDLNDSKGISQYRLRQVDLDDVAKYSDIRTVQGIGQNGKTIISPNPSTNGMVNVTFEASSRRDLQLTDMNGRMIKQWNGYNDNSLQLSNLTPGIYQLRIVDKETGTQSIEKIMVVNR